MTTDSPAFRHRRLAVYAAAVFGLASGALAGGSTADQVGHTSLLKRLGSANMPTGAGLVVGHTEAYSPEESTNYWPDFALQEFAGKNFIIMSGASATSTHSTTVGKIFYGSATSIAPQIPTIHMYYAGAWLGSNYLRTGTTVSPAAPPLSMRIVNCSWIADVQNDDDEVDNEALRRADFATVRDDLLIISGENNGSSSTNNPLMSHQFNGIAVGRTDGAHSHSDTKSTIDGPGRMNPQLVAPGSATSNSTPVVAAAAALMYDAAQTVLAGNPNASRSEVIKSLLITGAVRNVSWTNNPDDSGPSRGVTHRPLDDVFGAGAVNVDRAHRMLQIGEQDGSLSPIGAPVLPTGWDHVAAGQGQSTYWRVNLSNGASEFSVGVTWHRDVQEVDNEGVISYPSWSSADFDLELWRVGSGGELESLIGDPGVLFFDSGNVQSSSIVDNVELLSIRNLAPGEYVIELRREDVLASDFDAAVSWHAPRPADIVLDGLVGVSDLLFMLGEWGSCDPIDGCPANTDGDNTVGVADLLRLLGDWG